MMRDLSLMRKFLLKCIPNLEIRSNLKNRTLHLRVHIEISIIYTQIRENKKIRSMDKGRHRTLHNSHNRPKVIEMNFNDYPYHQDPVKSYQ